MTLQEIKEFAKEHRACESQYNKFCKLIESGDELKAWQTVLGNIDWLNDRGAGLDAREISILAQGIGLRWHEDGELQIKENWENGRRHGTRKEWRDNGTLWEEINYVNGELHGAWKLWHKNGILWIEENLENGRRHGTRKTWHEDGELRVEENWENGILIESK